MQRDLLLLALAELTGGPGVDTGFEFLGRHAHQARRALVRVTDGGGPCEGRVEILAGQRGGDAGPQVGIQVAAGDFLHGIGFGGTTRYDLGPFKLTEEIKLVKQLKGSFIVTGGAGEFKVSPGQLKANVTSFVELMKPHAALAAENGVVIGIENHVNNLIDTPDSLRWLADDIRNIPGLGIALAPYHLPQDTAVLVDLIRQCDQKLMLFYAWEHGMGCMKPMPKAEEIQQLPGRGKLDWKPLLMALKDMKFTGPTEIFMHPTPRGIPILPTAAETTAEIVRARKHLDSLI